MAKTMFFNVKDSDGEPIKLLGSDLCKLDWRIHTECKETLWSWVSNQWPPPRLSDVVAEYNYTLTDCFNSGCGVVIDAARLSLNQPEDAISLDFDSDPWIFVTDTQERYIKEQEHDRG